MLNRFLILLFIAVTIQATAQDNPNNRQQAADQLQKLKAGGAIVVRLKTNDKSVAAYRNNGRPEVADRIERERAVQNKKIMAAFKANFDFCKVYFIYAKNSAELVAGKTGLFLNDDLKEVDSIKMDASFYVFAEYGDVTSNVRTDEYHYDGVHHTEASSTPASSSSIVLSDTAFNQLQQPFPYYQNVMLDNYDKTITRLNNAFHKAYYHLIEVPAMKKEIKKNKKSFQ
jgi:hypothetical protein